MSENEKIELPEGENPLDNIGQSFVGYFVPCADVLLQQTNPTIAAVFGKIWLLSRNYGFSSMGLVKMADQLGMHKNTVKDAIDTLCGEPEIGSGKSRKKNKYFDKSNCIMIEVTTEDDPSCHYAPLFNRFNAYVAKHHKEDNRKGGLTDTLIKEIQAKIKAADESGNNSKESGNNYNESGNNQIESGNNLIESGNNYNESGNNSSQSGNNSKESGNNSNESGNRHKHTLEYTVEDTVKETVEDTVEEIPEEKREEKGNGVQNFSTKNFRERIDSLDSDSEEDLPALALTEKLRAYADQNNNGVLDSSVIEAVTGMSSSWGEEQPEFIFDEDDI